jgi:hypothetical protein
MEPLSRQRFGDLIANLHDGIQCRERILERSGRIFTPAGYSDIPFRPASKDCALVDDLAAVDDRVFGQDAHDTLVC